MSRSYHSTIRKYFKEKKFKYSNDNIKEENLNQIGEELSRKSFTKRMIIENRRISNGRINYSQPFDPNCIEIKIINKEKYAHFPASKEDLLGVIKRMPYNVLSGIHSITLCLGKEYQEDNYRNSDEVIRDPYTERICTNEEGPIYTPRTLGTYYGSTCKIFIYAYVYDMDEVKLGIIEPYLRLQMLNTLVHEIAHHEDNLLRTGGGRWLGFNDGKCEDYAEIQQMNWAETAVIPYLLDTYPEEYNSLLDWIEKYGGVKISLKKLTGESKGQKIGHMIKPDFSAASAVKDLFKNINNGMNERDAMLEFAMDLHYGDYYEECTKALDTLLLKNPKDSDALGVKADTYIDQKEYIKAECTAKECLLINNKNIDALRALCYVNQKKKDWQGLVEISRLGIEATSDEPDDLRAFTQMNIISLLYLKEYEEAEKQVHTLQCDGVHQQRKLAFEALVKLFSGDEECALTVAKGVLAEENIIGPARALLKAIYNYVIVYQGRDLPQDELSKYDQDYLLGTDIMGLLEQLKEQGKD